MVLDRPVKLKDVVEALDFPEEWHVYLNRKTGEILYFSEDDRMVLERMEEEEDLEDLPKWQRENLPELRERQEALESGQCVPLPSRFDIHEWEIMKRFCLSIGSDWQREFLLDAIHGSGAFRYFKSAVHRLGIAEKWYQFRAAAFEEIAIEWLEAEEIPFERA